MYASSLCTWTLNTYDNARFWGSHIDLFSHYTSGLLDKAFYMESHWSMRCSHSKYQDLCNCHWVFHDSNNNNSTFQHVYLHHKISDYREKMYSQTLLTPTLRWPRKFPC